MADWIKTRRQHDGTFLLVLARRLPGADGAETVVEDFRTFRSPLEFANAVLTAHGVEPAYVFGAAANPPNTQPPNCDGMGNTAAPPSMAEDAAAQMRAHDLERDDDEGERYDVSSDPAYAVGGTD